MSDTFVAYDEGFKSHIKYSIKAFKYTKFYRIGS